jgi:hypothetical protein
MSYLPNVAAQTRLFLLALGFGFALGVLYDVFRVVRLLFTRPGKGKKRGPLLVQDLLYCLCCAVLSFFFFLAAGDAGLRGFGIAGELLGWLIYYFSLGTVAVRCTTLLVAALRRLGRWLLRCLRAPAALLFRFFASISRVMRKNAKKNTARVKKNLHFHLQKAGGMVYNRNRRGRLRQKKLKEPDQIASNKT